MKSNKQSSGLKKLKVSETKFLVGGAATADTYAVTVTGNSDGSTKVSVDSPADTAVEQ